MKTTIIKTALLLTLLCGIFSSMPNSKVNAASKRPAKVTKVKVISVGYNALKITWKKAARAKKYEVYRATSKNGRYKKIKTTKGRVYINKNLITGKKYYYKVRGINDLQKGAFSSRKGNAPKLKKSSTTPLVVKTVRKQMLSNVNKKRRKVGLEPLELYSPINKTAQKKAKDMYKTGILSHYSSNLGYFQDQFAKAGIRAFKGGENIAKGQSSVQSVMQDWMNSSGHRANILDESYTHLGIGYYNGYWVQQFVAHPQ